VTAPGPVVGFDLDMTLVDTRARITASLRRTLAEAGITVTPEQVWPFIGPPLADTLTALAPGREHAPLVARYRALHDDPTTAPLTALPGAADALAAVRAAGGRTIVVSAKVTRAVELVLRETGLAPLVDVAEGGRFATQKSEFLLAHGAGAYVGDHIGDVLAARAAGAVAVGVATGPPSPQDLSAAGADVVLPDLTSFGDWFAEHLLDHRLAALDARLREIGSVLVAFSGGADSALVLAAAARALGAANVVAATAVSESLPPRELAAARELADHVGVRLVVPRTNEIDREGYRANGGDRCFHCKAELLDTLGPVATQHGLAAVATGTNADDVVAGFRPGIRAAGQRGAVTPLLDAALTKDQVRRASRRWGLPTWDKPASACLSSRVAFGVPISAPVLRRVGAAEEAVRGVLTGAGLAVGDLRVRDLGGSRARVELAPATLASAPDRVLDDALLAVRRCGFDAAEMDPRGFRSGSMNELLADPDAYR
jgi:uncharacterized protein